MNLNEVRNYFDKKAQTWDEQIYRNEHVIDVIIKHSGIRAGASVLDVGCGTGALISDYLSHGAKKVVAIDISQNMIAIAKKKYQNQNVKFYCEDATYFKSDERFDSIVIYNAFPHFCDQEELIHHLAGLLNPEGTLTVAHNMSRNRLEAHHSGDARYVSKSLMPIENLVAIFEKYLSVDTIISTQEMYQVAGHQIN